MKVDWDYSKLAKHYDRRAPYSPEALEAIIKIVGLNKGDSIADVGAGTGKLTVPMAKYGLMIKAIEPNNEMRFLGQKNTDGQTNIEWIEAIAERTGLADQSVGAFMMGSSFNVVDQQQCLLEANRVLHSQGWFVCMWNHRDLEDDLQNAIEQIIKNEIVDYNYGTRRMDPSNAIISSSKFKVPLHISHRFIYEVHVNEFIDAWQSHATLKRQAKDSFELIMDKITFLLKGKERIKVPYRTNCWIAKKI